MPMNLPMLLTWVRIVLIPLIVGLYCTPQNWLSVQEQNTWGALVFVLAAVTDAFDGYLARRWNQTSAFGAFLDPVADKLMVSAALIILVYLERIHPIIAFIVIGREITISALREWMASIGAQKSIAVNWFGKLKTAAQMVAIPILLFDDAIIMGLSTRLIGDILIWVASILTLWSMFYYLSKAWPLMREKTSL